MFLKTPQRADQPTPQTCWAAAMTSFVKSSPKYYDAATRSSATPDGFIEFYADLPGGALKPLSQDSEKGLIPLLWDYHLGTATYGYTLNQSLTTFIGNVLRNGSYVIITYRSWLDRSSNFYWWHAVVAYGLSGDTIYVMDPNRARPVYLTRKSSFFTSVTEGDGGDGNYQLIFHESAS